MELLTVSDVARRLNVTPDAVRDMERRGRLKAIRTAGHRKLRLFDEAAVEECRRARHARARATKDR